MLLLSSPSASPNQLPVRRWVTMEKKQPCHTLVLIVKGVDRSTLQLTLCVVSLERPWMILMIIICKGTAVCYFFVIDATYIDLTSLFLTQACWISNQHAFAILDLIENRNLTAMLNNPKKNVEEFARSSKVNDDIANQIRKSLTSTGKSYDDCLYFNDWALVW